MEERGWPRGEGAAELAAQGARCPGRLVCAPVGSADAGPDEGMLIDGLEPNCAEKKTGGINNSQEPGSQDSSFRFCLKINGTYAKCWPERDIVSLLKNDAIVFVK